MTKTKSTKRALLLSGLALIMCVSLLIGTTFAWFTDSVTSSGNIIKSGKLDVEMMWKDATENGAQKTYKDASTGAIFNYSLWEPGYVEAKNIMIDNVGNLALKYQLNIIANGAVSELADVIDVFYAKEELLLEDRDLSALTHIGVLSDVIDDMSSYINGELLEDDTDYVTIALKMQESAGNEYRDISIGTDFTVQLLATQYTYEADSFDNQYDSNLELKNQGISRVLDDGSTVFYFNEESGNYGTVQLTALPENLGSEYVVPAEVTALGSALAGVTLDKLTIPASVNYARKSLTGATIDEVVLEEGITTIPDRMFYRSNVGSVEIPSSVTTIDQYAFSEAAPKTLVIPASVTTLGEGAFAYMPNLETVIFNGDVTLPKYAFRACPKLTTVEFKGDVTVATTDMVFSNYETGGKDDMKFYVNSEENAENLIPCLGAYNDTKEGKDRNKWTVYINEAVFKNVKNVTEFQAALTTATSDTIINLTADITGDVTVKKNPGADLIINGNENDFTGLMTVIGNTTTGSLTVKNVNFVAASGKTATIDCPKTYVDGNSQNNYVQNVTVEKCTFTDPDGDRTCVAINHSSNGQKNWLVKGCTVDSSMHSFMQVNNIADSFVVDGCFVYSKNGINVNQSEVLTVIGSTFDVDGYAIRCGVNQDAIGTVAETYLIKGCTLKAGCDGGKEAVIVLRATSSNATLTIEETTIEGVNDILNQASNVTIIK